MAFLQKLNPNALSTLLITITLLFVVARSTPNTGIGRLACNVNKYSPNELYAANVAYVLADLMNVTPNAGYDYYTHSPSETAVCHGHGTCSSSLSFNDCADCLTATRAALLNNCASAVGADVGMVDCTMRYENYSF